MLLGQLRLDCSSITSSMCSWAHLPLPPGCAPLCGPVEFTLKAHTSMSQQTSRHWGVSADGSCTPISSAEDTGWQPGSFAVPMKSALPLLDADAAVHLCGVLHGAHLPTGIQ